MTIPKIIAHRGVSELAPENTLAAFAKALEDRAEGIEFDVQLSKDAVPMVFHDENLKRIAGRHELVRELNSKELQKVDAGSWFNLSNPDKARKEFAAERIFPLRRTLDFLKDYRGLIYIELKCEVGSEDIRPLTEAVGKVIRNSPLMPQIIVKSFNLDMIPLIRKQCPEVKTATLFAPQVMIILRKEKRMIHIARDLGADYLSLHFSLATRKLLKKAEKANLRVAIWTADSPRWVGRAVKIGIDHIITNNPAPLLKKRREILNQ